MASEHTVAVSARTGAGIDELRELVATLLPRPQEAIDVVVPYTRGDLVSQAHTTGEVLGEEHLEEGTRLRARVDSSLAAALRDSAVG